jgi:hypothetical protein
MPINCSKDDRLVRHRGYRYAESDGRGMVVKENDDSG